MKRNEIPFHDLKTQTDEKSPETFYRTAPLPAPDVRRLTNLGSTATHPVSVTESFRHADAWKSIRQLSPELQAIAQSHLKEGFANNPETALIQARLQMVIDALPENEKNSAKKYHEQLIFPRDVAVFTALQDVDTSSLSPDLEAVADDYLQKLHCSRELSKKIAVVLKKCIFSDVANGL